MPSRSSTTRCRGRSTATRKSASPGRRRRQPSGGLRRARPRVQRKGAPRLMADITMPQLGETVTEGTITKWFKQVGDEVAEDEPLFEVSTDKVDSEVPSPTSGYVAEILVDEGETVDVGTRLAVIADAPPSGGVAAAPVAAPRSEAPPAPAPRAGHAGHGAQRPGA